MGAAQWSSELRGIICLFVSSTDATFRPVIIGFWRFFSSSFLSSFLHSNGRKLNPRTESKFDFPVLLICSRFNLLGFIFFSTQSSGEERNEDEPQILRAF